VTKTATMMKYKVKAFRSYYGRPRFKL